VLTSNDDHTLITAIVGGGCGCEAILRMVDTLGGFRMSIVGVADINPDASGLRCAREMGIEWITTDYRDLYTIPNLDLIIELTGSEKIRIELERTRPRHIRLIDHFSARLFWELHKAEEAIIEQRNLLRLQVESERERIAQIFDSIPDEVVVVDTAMVVQHANATFLKQHGVRLEEVQGRHYYNVSEQLRGKCDINKVNKAFQHVLNEKGPHSIVCKYFDPNDEARYMAIEVAPLLNLDGSIMGMIEMTRDISRRILLEEELKATEVQLKKFMELAPLATYVKNRQGQYIEVNRATCTLLGRNKREIIGKTDDELLPKGAARVMRTGDQEVLQTQKQFSIEGEVLLDGNRVSLSTIKYPVLDTTGKVSAVAGLSKDVTNQLEMEAELRRTREYLQNILDNAPLMVVTTDLDGRIVSFNRQAEASLGYEAKEVIGKPMTRLFGSPQDWEMLARRVEQANTVQDHSSFGLRKDGSQITISITLAQLKDNAGNMIGMVAMSRDITQRQALINQVIQSERLAAVGRLAAGVAHEINNPMAVIAEISGYLLDVVEAGPKEKQRLLDKEMLEGLPKIEAQVRRCRSITSRLLRFAHKSEVRTEVADVSESLDEILPYLEKQARLAGVQIHRRLNTELPKLSIEDLQLEEVLINLITNAIHAMHHRGYGNIWLFAARKDGRVILTIKDDGPGIAEEVKDRLFDPFVTTKPVGQGTGLGLSICYGIVKFHHGEILVESEPGKGTSFQIILPIYQGRSKPITDHRIGADQDP
jgi:PAS domain S-box-containing protein